MSTASKSPNEVFSPLTLNQAFSSSVSCSLSSSSSSTSYFIFCRTQRWVELSSNLCLVSRYPRLVTTRIQMRRRAKGRNGGKEALARRPSIYNAQGVNHERAKIGVGMTSIDMHRCHKAPLCKPLLSGGR